MKTLSLAFLLGNIAAYSQLTLPTASDSAIRKYHVSSYSYLEQFKGHPGYGAPLILTSDGGAAAFGDGDLGAMLVKFDKTGKESWKRIIPVKGTEMESQSVAEDKAGNYYGFILVYDETKYRGGSERMVCMNKAGVIVWDKFIGAFSQINNPTVSYIRSLDDGRIYLRGHVALKSPPKGEDPKYHFWEAWINSKGTLTQQTGDIIDWSKPEWKKRFSPD